MVLKIHAIGGYSEVGKNMTVLETEDDAFIFDEGFFLPAIVQLAEQEKRNYTVKKLREIKAIPDDATIHSIKNKVRAQLISHAHLDHVGAVPFMSDEYNAPIVGTPFTTEVLNTLLTDNNISLRNKIRTVHPNSHFNIQGKKEQYKIEFINMTHSTPQTSLIAVHTKEGIILYANDFKLDNNPVLGLKPNYERLRELQKIGVKALVLDSLYSGAERKTPSEKIARTLLEEVLLTIDNKNAGIITTTFSSHIARLKSIVDFSRQLNREPIFLGRSLSKYCEAAKRVGLAGFLEGIKICAYRKHVEKMLKKAQENRKQYLLVCTGHQGEPGSILERMSRNILPFKINKEDNIVFSSSVIPTPVNKESFAKMESHLLKRNARLFRDVHVSGHGGREDLRDFVNLLQPEHIIPAHGDHAKTQPMADLAKEMGYSDSQIHLMEDRRVIKI